VAGKASSVSPYLLRPLRTLEQVLGGRGGVVQPRPERAEGRRPFNSRDALGEIANKEHVTPHPAD
jgi:hypothetical protein